MIQDSNLATFKGPFKGSNPGSLMVNNKYYRQIFGTPMGSPISPFFADIVMDDLEKICLERLKSNHNGTPLFYYRYVDDIIICVKKEHIDHVINTINSYHNSLHFTHELKNNNSINFSDLNIIKKNKSIITNCFQKLTSSGRVINFFSNHPIQQKKNIIYNLVDRAFLLSQKSFHKANLRKVKTMLLNNDYPLEFIN